MHFSSMGIILSSFDDSAEQGLICHTIKNSLSSCNFTQDVFPTKDEHDYLDIINPLSTKHDTIVCNLTEHITVIGKEMCTEKTRFAIV